MDVRVGLESRVPKNWCFWTVVLNRLLRDPWTARRSNQSILKEISPECSLEGLIEAETPILWPPHAKSWLTGKDPDAGKDWGQEEKGTTENEMVGWHHWLDGHGFGWTLGIGDGQEAWRAAVHGVAKSRTRLREWTELNFMAAITIWQILYQLRHQGSPRTVEWVAYPFSSRPSHPGIKQGSPAPQADSSPTELPGKPNTNTVY